MRKKLLGLLLLICLTLSSGLAEESRDVIFLKSGGKIKGKILKETSQKVVIATPYHTVHQIYREEIREIRRALDLEDQLKKRLVELEKNPKPELYYQLGLFCEKNPKLKSRAKEIFQIVLSLDPDHSGARGKLGYIRFEGKWVTLAELERSRKKAEQAEKERLRKWKAWKKAQENLRRKTVEGTKKVYKAPEVPKKGIYGKFLGMFRDEKAEVPWDKAYVYRSKYYRIRSNTKKKYIKVYGRVLDQFFEIFQKVFRFRRIPRRKSEVWIYANRREFLDRTGKKTALGFYSLQTRRVTTYHGRWGRDTNTFTVLAHEGTHQFQHLVLGTESFWKTPIWIIEGLAVFLSTADFKKNKVVIGGIPQDRLLPLQRMIRRGKSIPLRELIRTPQRRFSGTHYAHAWGIIYWMVYTSKKNKRVFMRIWDKCRRGGLTTEEFEQVIRVDVDKWEEVWKKWILKLK